MIGVERANPTHRHRHPSYVLMRRSHGEMRASKAGESQSAAQRRRLRGMYRSWAALDGVAPMSHLRTCWLLRLLARPPRQQALQRDRTCCDAGVRVRRLEVVLRARVVHVARWGEVCFSRASPSVCVLCTEFWEFQPVSDNEWILISVVDARL